MNPLILFFEEIQDSHFDLVGGKAFSLGKLQSLKQNIKVPEGFVLTTEFYKAFLELTGIKKEVYKIFGTIDVTKTFDLQQKSEEIRALFYASKFPQELVNIVLNPFYKLKSRFDDSFMVAVRSSATTEDLEVASFAGQFDTFLCVGDEDELIGRIRGCLAGLFNARAISYRVGRKISEESVLLGIVIQRMIRADRGASGVMFSLDTETGFDKVVYINSIYGFGELLVGGKVNPDSIYVFKDTLLQGKRPIIDKKCGFKQEKLIYCN
ncbi:MAG: PEP/pyruvate-binding domain-containing protein, partial [Candidatus Bathyarchaeia archaeon]